MRLHQVFDSALVEEIPTVPAILEVAWKIPDALTVWTVCKRNAALIGIILDTTHTAVYACQQPRYIEREKTIQKRRK